MVESVAAKYAGRLKAVQINVQDNMEVAMQFGVMAVPNVLFFKNGQVVNQIVGFQNEMALTGLVEKVLA